MIDTERIATITVRFKDGTSLTLNGAHLVNVERERTDAGPQLVIRLAIPENVVWTNRRPEGYDGAAIP